jgi:glycosyltransferase involved in cell wall biosynthesis
MKILHLITDLDIGGTEMMLYKLLSKIDRSRFQHSVISMTKGGTLHHLIEDLGVPVKSLGMHYGVPNPICLYHLFRQLRKERPILLQTWLYHSDLLGLLAGKLARVPYIAWNVRCSNMEMQHYSWISALVLRSLTVLSPIPQAVVVNSESGLKVHEKLGYRPRRWIKIPNGFDTDRFRFDAEARVAFRKELSLSSDTLLVGMVARFDPMKDHSNFFRGASLLLEKFVNVHFVLVGHSVDATNGEIVRDIHATGRVGNFHLLGERKDIHRIMAALDIATSSSRSEGFPNAIGEAMACGTPCVVTDVGDSALLVGDTGRIVPPKNPEGLANAWQQIIELGDEGRNNLGTAARRRIEENFSLPIVVAHYEKFYEESIAHVRSCRF